MYISHNSIKEVERHWRWYHGVIFYALVQGLAFGLSGLVRASVRYHGKSRSEPLGNVAYFKSLKQAKITPPSWAFGPVCATSLFICTLVLIKIGYGKW